VWLLLLLLCCVDCFDGLPLPCLGGLRLLLLLLLVVASAVALASTVVVLLLAVTKAGLKTNERV
jgi:hypothetical protein